MSEHHERLSEGLAIDTKLSFTPTCSGEVFVYLHYAHMYIKNWWKHKKMMQARTKCWNENLAYEN